MRIYSSFRDYYDTVLPEIDLEGTPFIRNTEELVFSVAKEPVFENLWALGWPTYYQYNRKALGFCGKFYPILVLKHTVPRGIIKQEVIKYFYNFEDYDNYYKKLNPIAKGQQLRRRYDDRYDTNIKSWAEKIAKFENTDLFFKYKCPYFIFELKGGEVRLTKTPDLRSYEFYKVKDPMQAYQEIDMFVSGVLGAPEKKIETISDKIKIAKKGFDDWSFKKRPLSKEK